MATGPSVKDTEAYLVATSNPITFSITTGTWEEPAATDLALSPGDSKAVRHDRVPASFPIASFDENGKLTLDFGEVVPGNSDNSPDVFVLEVTSSIAATVSVSAGGGFADFVDSVSIGGAERLGNWRRVSAKVSQSSSRCRKTKRRATTAEPSGSPRRMDRSPRISRRSSRSLRRAAGQTLLRRNSLLLTATRKRWTPVRLPVDRAASRPWPRLRFRPVTPPSPPWTPGI